jgi:hypothetical protein
MKVKVTEINGFLVRVEVDGRDSGWYDTSEMNIPWGMTAIEAIGGYVYNQTKKERLLKESLGKEIEFA